MNQNNLHRLVFGALFTAITCIFTMVIQVPSLGMSGYVNIGDTAVLLSAWTLGGWYGALAAGLGSALADLLSGYAIYAPGTFAIKFLMALSAAGILRLIPKAISGSRQASTVGHILSGITAEVIMVIGYLLYEAFFLGYGAAALPAVLSNSVQAVTNLVIAAVLITALECSKALRRATA